VELALTQIRNYLNCLGEIKKKIIIILFNSCGRTNGPCGGNFTVDQVHTMTHHDIVYLSPRYQVRQLKSHQNKTSVNKYIVSTIRRDTGSLVQSFAIFQNSLPFGFGLQEDIVWDLHVLPLFTSGGPIDSGEYTIQLAFDATDGGGEVYYSCLDVDFSSSPKLMISATTIIVSLMALLLI